MNAKKIILFSVLSCAMFSCTPYIAPPRELWGNYLKGASFTDMIAESKIAKKPVYLGSGGKLIKSELNNAKMEYGDKNSNENSMTLDYMARLEYQLYDSLRKPGISVQRAGTDIVVILVRDAFIKLDAPEISKTGEDTLGIISDILQEYDATFIEISGYTDSMRDQNAAKSLSLDMAERVSLFFAQNKINTARMFIIGRGSARPIAAQDDIGRLTNRRVEIRISPAR